MNWLLDLLDAIPALWRMVEIKTEEMFLRQLRTYCLQLFRGELGEFAWIDDMSTTIADQMGKAWREGAKAVEVEPSEFTDEDNEELNKIIASEYEYVLALGSDILALRLMGGSLEDYRNKFASRIEVWAHRYTDVVNQAKAHFGGRIKLEWVLGETEEHCATCAAMAGTVAWSKEWDESPIKPQNPPNEKLECGGWRCDCRLEVTDKRRTYRVKKKLQISAEKSLKYDPNQPRVPAGNSDGGQWTDGATDISHIDEHEEKIRYEDVECSYSYNQEGEFVLFKRGSRTEIGYTEEEGALFRGGTLTHNHPNGFSFSEVDMRIAYQLQLKEIRAVTDTGTFIARPGVNGWPDEAYLNDIFEGTRRAARAYIEQENAIPDDKKLSHAMFSAISQVAKIEYEVIEK